MDITDAEINGLKLAREKPNCKPIIREVFEILAQLEDKMGGQRWVLSDFREILEDDDILKFLQQAEKETAGYFINKHGPEHGLCVALNVSRLFRLIEKGFVLSDYMESKLLSDKKQVLFVLTVASFVHDLGRFYEEVDHELQIGYALERLKSLIMARKIFRHVLPTYHDLLIEKIRELCLCHDKKTQPSNKVELALIKLADALDCTKTRVYTEEDNPTLRGDLAHKFSTILQDDKHPERYFGCLAVDDIKWELKTPEGTLEIEFVIKSYAASPYIKLALNSLAACERGAASVREFSKHVWVFITDNDLRRHLIYPRTEELLSEPRARIPFTRFEITIKDKEGNGEVENFWELQNVDEQSGILHYNVAFWGYKPILWENITNRTVLIQKDGTEIELPLSYIGAEDDNKKHLWTVIFRDKADPSKVYRLNPGETATIKANYSWDGLVNTCKDEFTYGVFTPCEHLDVKINFPQRLLEARTLLASITIREAATKDTIFTLPISPQIATPSENLFISAQFNNLKRGYIYLTEWEIK